MQPDLWTPSAGYPDGARARDWLKQERRRERARWRHIRDPRVDSRLQWAWTPVQHKLSGAFATEPITLAYTSNVTNGNLLVIFYQWGASAGTLFTASKSSGTATISTVTTAKQIDDTTNNQSIGLAWCLVTGTGSLTMQCNSGQSAGSAETHLSEWSGNAAATPNDVFGGQINSASPVTTGNISPTVAGDLIIAAAADDSGISTLSVGSGYTLLDGPAGSNMLCVEYQVQGAAAPIAATWATTGAESTLTVVGSFKPATVADNVDWLRHERGRLPNHYIPTILPVLGRAHVGWRQVA